MVRRSCRLGLRLVGLSVALVVLSACDASATPWLTRTGTPAGSAAAGSPGPTLHLVGTATPGILETPTAGVETAAPGSPSAAPSATSPATGPTPAAPATALTRGPWVRGQTVIEDFLVAPYQGWVRTNRGVYQTLDDGATWATVTPPHLIVSKMRGLGALDANHALLAVADVTRTTTTYYIWRTTDGGASWAYVALPAIRHAVSCGTDRNCVPGTADAGASIDYVSAGVAFLTLPFYQDIEGVYSFIYETVDGGQTWTRLNFPGGDLYSGGNAPQIHFASATAGVVISGGDANSTSTGWGHWTTRQITDMSADNPWVDLTPSLVDSSHWYISGQIDTTGTLTYAFSSDQGRTWVRRSCSGLYVAGIEDVTVRFIDDINWVASVVTGDGFHSGPSYTFMTGTAGAYWSNMGPQAAVGSRALFLDLVHGWAGPTENVSTNRLYTTTDHGVTWQLITP
jgi:hypothetical protein